MAAGARHRARAATRRSRARLGVMCVTVNRTSALASSAAAGRMIRVIEQGDGWSEARLRHAEESLAAAVEKADRIITKAREQAARDAARESDEMLDPLNRAESADAGKHDEDDEPPLFDAEPARPAEPKPTYLRDAW
jgi:hypothetical protein